MTRGTYRQVCSFQLSGERRSIVFLFIVAVTEGFKRIDLVKICIFFFFSSGTVCTATALLWGIAMWPAYALFVSETISFFLLPDHSCNLHLFFYCTLHCWLLHVSFVLHVSVERKMLFLHIHHCLRAFRIMLAVRNNTWTCTLVWVKKECLEKVKQLRVDIHECKPAQLNAKKLQ